MWFRLSGEDYKLVLIALHYSAHAIVCIDANFAQKRRKSAEVDPALTHADTRFVLINDAAGRGLLIAGEDFSFSAHHYSQEALTRALHTYELKNEDTTEVCVDGAMGPLGSNSCGPEPLEEDRLYFREARTFRFQLSPIDLQKQSAVHLYRRLSQEG